ncbi:hypothetical protein PC119_g7274 [Phytophthora cactorum]|nr:hypothetical protein PC119_g7274 [Phytophthora cactorum]KAG3178106.1 hypothetical protein C6341_g8129 [Phytophthora cactorum]
MESTQEHKQHDDGLPLLDADGHPRDSIHTALLEDKTPEILFHEDAIGDTDSDNEDDDVVSTDGSVVLDDDAKMVMYKSTGKVGSKQKWGHEPLAADFKMLSVGIDMLDGVVVKVEGYYLPEEQKVTEGMQTFELTKDECITKVHLFRVRREIHAIQFVTNLRTSERFGGTKHGELCKAVEAPEGKYIASFFGDISKGEEEMELGVRFADRPVGGESTEAEVAEIDQSKFHKEVTLFGSSQSVMKSKMGPSHCCESCWEELLRSHRTALRLFTCLRAWRYVTLQLKHRFQKPTPREWQQARFFEMELPLHAAVTALNHSEGTLDESFELLGSFYALYPSSTVLLDHQRRPPLYYAIEQHWGLEKLSWLVDKSLDTVLEKDSDGLSVVTHARMNACPEELVIRLAVAAASRCILALDELLNGQHFESARRLCHRALQDFFAGVPKFPHARCREVLGVCRKYDEGHAYAAAMAIRDVWMHYTDTWGHFGAPLIQRDLPETLFPVIQSFVEVALVAKGEPLNYQWFVQQDGQDDGIPIDGATQSFIFISPSIQPHNEGVYYCEIANRVGRVVSTRMVVRVVDDRVPSDPTLNFVVDRALLTPGGHTMHCLKASAGGRVHHLQTDATIVFQPDFFICLDGDGNDVSDTHGAEIAIFRRVDDEARLILRNGERLASCLFEILPQSMGDLLRPALLWLPHCLVADANHSAVVVEVVHRGFDTKITISTTAYAGCVRVAWCSVDHFGDYSNPLLLPPLTDLDSDSLSDQELAAAGSHSVEMESTSSRLQQLLDDLQIDSSALSKVYGLPRTVRNATDAVAALLEDKVSLGSCNFELALLLSGYKTLEKQLTQIKLASDSYAKLMEPFLRVQRAIPELERCLADSLPITRRLDELLREAYEVIVKLSSPGWLQYFLMDEWFEDALHKIFVDLAELLASDDCALQCAKALQAGLEAPADNGIPWIMKTARSHLLIAVGRLQEATDQATKKLICRELCHTLHLHSSHQQGDDEEELIALTAAKFLAEFESPTSQQALNTLSQQDSFMKHLVSVTPHDGEKCTHVPEAVHFDLDPFIRGVNRTGMHLVIRVANVSLDSCVVQGKATFCGRTTKLSFVPAAEFERKSRYRVSVREQEILSSLGGTLPERPPFTIYFSTPA